jgi:D-sedoheptulose 7-phosphate isomerase
MSEVVEILDAKQYFQQLQRVARDLSHDPINQIANALVKAHESGRMVYVFGNGGSASLASHLACDLGKGTAYCNGGKRFRVLALTDNLPTLTAWANDFSYEEVFAEQLRDVVEPRDVAFAISGSGNSQNVLRALHVARAAGATTVGITGFQGGNMKAQCDICAVVPSDDMQIIEDLHLAMAHALFRMVYSRMSRRAPRKSMFDLGSASRDEAPEIRREVGAHLPKHP